MQQNMQNIISDVLFAEHEELHNMQNIISDISFCRTRRTAQHAEQNSISDVNFAKHEELKNMIPRKITQVTKEQAGKRCWTELDLGRRIQCLPYGMAICLLQQPLET
jgi:hypothetical protein